jgi:predicted nucleic acid-binding protein
VNITLRALVREKEELGVTEFVVMEVLAGARSRKELSDLESLMVSYRLLKLEGRSDYEEAAALYRACRAGGETIRKLGDCLVAVPVIREGAELLHNDSDFDAIARHSSLRVYAVV